MEMESDYHLAGEVLTAELRIEPEIIPARRYMKG
jgi:hypothetical protein